MTDKPPDGSGNGSSSDGREVVSSETLEAVVQSGKRRRMVGFAGAATVVVAIVGGTFVATQLGDSAPSTTTTTRVDPTPSATTPLGSSLETDTTYRDDAASSIAPRRRERVPEIPPAGTISFEWETSEFPLPAGIDAWVQEIIAVEDGYLAFGQGFDFEDGEEHAYNSLVWESPDGLNWDLAATGSFPVGFELNNLLATDSDLVAVGMIFEDEPPWTMTPLVLTSPDGRSWASTTLTADLAENEHLYMNGAAARAAGIIVYGSIEFQPPEPPLVLSKDGKTMVIDNNQFTLTISADATGAVLYEGTPEDIWDNGGGETEDGLAVHDPTTRELVLVVPWEELDAAYGVDDDDGITLVFERDGYRLVLDERFDEHGGTFRVEDVVSGAILFSGPSNDLFQGLPPRFEDSQGNVILEFTWDEFYQAEEQAYGSFEEGFEDQYTSRPIVFHSPDGTEFTQVNLGPLASNQNAWVNTALATPEGFTLLGSVSNAESGELMIMWDSPNGIDWTGTAAAASGPYIGSVVATETGLLGLGEGQAVWASTRGSEWEAVLAPRGPEGTEIGLFQLVAGGLGVLAQGEQYEFQEDTEGETFALDYTTQEGLRVLVEGDYVFLFDEDDRVLLEGFLDELDAESRIETDDENMVRFYGSDGELLLEVSEEELETGVVGLDDSEFEDSESPVTTAPPATGPADTIVSHDDFEGSSTPPIPVLYYSPDGQKFYEVVLDGRLTGFFFNQIAVGSDRVILIGEEDASPEFSQRTLTVFVGKLAA
jgi:hypothetical protein